MNILLGVTGSVAATLTEKLVLALKELGDVKIVITESAKPFLKDWSKFFTDNNEWTWSEEGGWARIKYKKDDPVLHIELRKWADVFIIAPLTVNTLAKMNYGLCDNLLTSIYRAWDWTKGVVVAPSANTMMWENNPTPEQIRNLINKGVIVVPPIKKELACGDTGEGAMANINDIVNYTKEALNWRSSTC